MIKAPMLPKPPGSGGSNINRSSGLSAVPRTDRTYFAKDVLKKMWLEGLPSDVAR